MTVLDVCVQSQTWLYPLSVSLSASKAFIVMNWPEDEDIALYPDFAPLICALWMGTDTEIATSLSEYEMTRKKSLLIANLKIQL